MKQDWLVKANGVYFTGAWLAAAGVVVTLGWLPCVSCSNVGHHGLDSLERLAFFLCVPPGLKHQAALVGER